MNIFEKMSIESRDWSGYNPETLDDAIKRGIELERKDTSAIRDRRERLSEAFGIGLGASVAIAVVILLFSLISLDLKRNRIFNHAYKLGQTTALSGDIDFELEENSIGEKVWIEIELAAKPHRILYNRSDWNIAEFDY